MTGSHEVTGSIPVGSTKRAPARELKVTNLVSRVTVLLFEDEVEHGLRPLLRMRPAFELRCGVFSLRERCELLGLPLRVRVRSELAELVRAGLPELVPAVPTERVLALNSRLLASLPELRDLASRAAHEDFALQRDGALVAAAGTGFEPSVRGDSSPLPLASYPWQLLHAIADLTRADFPSLVPASQFRWRSLSVFPRPGATYEQHFARPLQPGRARIDPGVHLLGAEQILLGADVRLAPGVVLDAEAGPIVIGAGSELGPHVSVLGPCVLGPGCRVNPGTRLRGATVFGALCRIGGEIAESIVLDASNKQHDGFLGHAVLGSWVNLGANTNVSDLKNNYGSVRVDFGSGVMDSGERFVGPTIADHCKTAIGALLGTGSVLDVACNVFGPASPPRYLRPFSFGAEVAELEKTLATAELVCARREAEFPIPMRELLSRVHAQR